MRGSSLDGEGIFQFVRKFAEFAETAGGCISFEGMDGATDAANRFVVFGILLQLQRFVVDGLQQLLRAFEEQLPQFRAALIGKTESSRHLDLLIGGAAVAMDHGEFISQAQQAFGVSDEQNSRRD